MSARLSLVLGSLFAITAACGGGSDSKTPDASTTDAPPSTVVRVDPCPGTVDATVMTNAGSYNPMATTINQGQVVKFEIGSGHDVTPVPPMTDANLVVPGGATRCFRFTATGTFNFKCSPHGFTGLITVQ